MRGHFIDLKGSLIRKRGSAIDNPIGFLVASVPKCFEGESFKQFREEQGREVTRHLDPAEERMRYWRQTEEHALYWQRRASYWETLNDPNASTQEKRIAQEALATMTEPTRVPEPD